jgi:hypothetical protein
MFGVVWLCLNCSCAASGSHQCQTGLSPYCVLLQLACSSGTHPYDVCQALVEMKLACCSACRAWAFLPLALVLIHAVCCGCRVGLSYRPQDTDIVAGLFTAVSCQLLLWLFVFQRLACWFVLFTIGQVHHASHDACMHHGALVGNNGS